MAMNSPAQRSRRDILKSFGAGAALLGVSSVLGQTKNGPASPPKLPVLSDAATAPFTLPKLGYAYDSLEPHFDARTMEIHHSKHHQAYIAQANSLIAAQPALQKMSAEEILRKIGEAPEAVRAGLRNHVGGHVNHALFWEQLGVSGGGVPRGRLGVTMEKTFGSFDAFQMQFNDAAMKRFGSGWAWLSFKSGRLEISSTANQDSPLSDGATPLLGLDVWEHAYYLKYQNRRADYLGAFWKVVQWERVDARFASVS